MMKEYVSTLMNVADNEIIEYCEFSRVTGCTREDFRQYVNNMLSTQPPASSIVTSYYALVSPAVSLTWC